MRPGRDCPLDYRYGAASLARAAEIKTETLWVVGGLYGNGKALRAVELAYAAEAGPKALVFNGDFHWFDVERFGEIDEAVARHQALRGNMETELGTPGGDAGCGCGYPDWVDEGTVERSNRILGRLRDAARSVPGGLSALSALPMTLVAEVGGERVAIVHGDADSLAGWGFSQEALATASGLAEATRAFDCAEVRAFASTHTCLPVIQSFAGGRVLANNGAAGMPNFRGTRFGLATRISVAPSAEALYRARAGRVFVEAVPVRYDNEAWLGEFLAQWPEGSDAHRSYFSRLCEGPQYTREQALRAQLAAAA
jgi:hypothetical protein